MAQHRDIPPCPDRGPLHALSPLDGRYADHVAALRPLFSEFALMRYRVQIEVAWLKALAAEPGIPGLPPMNASATARLDAITEGFSQDDAEAIKALETRCNHDVKAVEYFLRQRCSREEALAPCVPFIHFACTSEDINNLCYALMLKETRDQHLLPALHAVQEALRQGVRANRALPMACRTHGQLATPSTLGREMGVFLHRLNRQHTRLSKQCILGKINGATGNFNAHILACPDIDWPCLARHFVEDLGLHWNPHTTQIESHDYIVELLDIVVLTHRILIDLCRDIWGYVSLGFFRLRSQDLGEVGSSTMPHKVNPIDFENAEGNLGMANAVARHMMHALPVSRWQRDLSDSTLLRNLGSVFAHSVIALRALVRGLDKLQADETRIRAELSTCWALLAEPVQTVMRCHGIVDAYEQLKALTRGRDLDRNTLHEFIATLAIPEAEQERLKALTPEDYIGNAVRQADAIAGH